MRIVARNTVTEYAAAHADAAKSLRHWLILTRAAKWGTTQDVQAAFSKAKVLNAERVRFDISGGDYRLIADIQGERVVILMLHIGHRREIYS